MFACYFYHSSHLYLSLTKSVAKAIFVVAISEVLAFHNTHIQTQVHCHMLIIATQSNSDTTMKRTTHEIYICNLTSRCSMEDTTCPITGPVSVENIKTGELRETARNPSWRLSFVAQSIKLSA